MRRDNEVLTETSDVNLSIGANSTDAEARCGLALDGKAGSVVDEMDNGRGRETGLLKVLLSGCDQTPPRRG